MGMYSSNVSDAVGAAVGILGVMLIFNLAIIVLNIAMYILQSLGMYTIAQRRGIKHPWLAWLPVTNMWILGSIADQYRYVACGQVRNRRKVLLGLTIAYVAMGLMILFASMGWTVNLLMQVQELQYMAEAQAIAYIAKFFMGILGILLLALVVAVVLTVFQYICLYDLYASCNPENKVVFLVLSILVNVTMPFFVFACRKKDGGMPPRRDEIVTPELTATPETVEE